MLNNILIQLHSSNNTATIKVYVYGEFTIHLTLVMVKSPSDVLDVLNALGYNLGELLAARGNRANYRLYA